MIALGLILQILLLFFGAAIPILIAVQAIRRRLRMSDLSLFPLGAAVAGLLLELAALIFIPVTGNC